MRLPEPAPRKEKQDRSNLITRILTGLVGAPLVLLLVYLGGWPFTLAIFVWAVLALLEFYALGQARDMQGSVAVGLPLLLALVVDYTLGLYVLLLPLLALAAVAAYVLEWLRGTPPALRNGRALVTLTGLAYAGFPAAFLIAVRALPDGLIWVLALLFVTWGTDIMAYFGGRWWGKTPLAPRISPRKTREGAVVGLLSGVLIGVALLSLAGKLTPASLALVLLAAPVAVMGDLFESRLKRFFGAGDSHLAGLNIIPGHGGVLDRTDSLVWVAALFYLYLSLVAL